nr:hypothetical protein [Azotobacter chroococcum]
MARQDAGPELHHLKTNRHIPANCRSLRCCSPVGSMRLHEEEGSQFARADSALAFFNGLLNAEYVPVWQSAGFLFYPFDGQGIVPGR